MFRARWQRWRQKGWQFALLLVLAYLVRDLFLYVVLPVFALQTVCR